MIRQVFPQDITEFLRLIHENTTHQGKEKSTVFAQYATTVLTNKLINRLHDCPFFGYFDNDKLLTMINFMYCPENKEPYNSAFIGINLATNTIPLDRDVSKLPSSLLKVAKYGIDLMLHNNIKDFYTTGPLNTKWRPIVEVYTRDYDTKWEVIEVVEPSVGKSKFDFVNKVMPLPPGLTDPQVVKKATIKKPL